ncbi:MULTISPECIES: type VII toxin-antitoxin system HepT family RNase toxin [Shewanella]|uniref:DUF86 domain-containing protein n=1 Tax=Shewanella scandinavica TaxID=3063538 RepID=A0ABU3FUF3_9GAMM|nr:MULTISPECIES: DUF86 domain-containing protein [Shewanella]MCL1133006.1 DUF86 domain-containing protein [Shewanella hafniensis]MDT3278986.1 DUF86 domain-containing protein [Shewanella sp. SP2S1-2]MDT3296880.1 DUF86 domain-containing protein [Shewanella sp. SP2S2-6]GIU36998.1 hypothetical protein TUM4637_35880 [Shewanella hafniensis]
MSDNIKHDGYLAAMRVHVQQCQSDLEELRNHFLQAPLDKYQRLALQRLMQISIESAIGIAKHWAQQVNQRPILEAYQAFDILNNAGLLKGNAPWRQIIGMRNVLVHDYLNLDEPLLEVVIRQQLYAVIFDFCYQGLAALERPSAC